MALVWVVPAGMSCGDYMADFFNAGGSGYIVNNNTENCQFCAYKTGSQFYLPFEIYFDDRWRDLGIFFAFIGSNLIILFLASRYLNFNKR